ncbi:MAG TPA: DUF4124 domain-containing protein [Geobacteraceae bacterium]
MKRALLVMTLLMFAVPAAATTYTWEDDQGTVNFTEDYGKIPKKYRKKAKVLGGEEEEPSVVVEPEQGEKGKPKAATPRETSEQPQAEQKNTVFGGKEGKAWRAEFGQLKADLKASEDQLVDLRKRLADTSKMSRSEYLRLQDSIRNLENRILGLRERLDDLKAAANRAGVPDEFR